MELPGESSAMVATGAHCHAHAHFVEGCPTCGRARANFLPYPVKKTAPLPRSFGFTDDVTAAKLSGGETLKRFGGDASAANELGDPEFSLSLAAIRFLLKLFWPFGRIL